MSRKVNYVKFHQGLFVKELGDLGQTLPSQSRTDRELAMSYDGANLSVKITFRGKQYEILVPSANVSVMQVDPEPTPNAKISKAA